MTGTADRCTGPLWAVDPQFRDLVLTAEDSAEWFAGGFACAGLPPDSVRYGYRPLYHRAIFAPYATACQNAEALAAATLQFVSIQGLRPEIVRLRAGMAGSQGLPARALVTASSAVRPWFAAESR